MRKHPFILLVVFFAVALTSLPLRAQSGRKTTEVAPKAGAKAGTESTTSPEIIEGASEAPTPAGGEAVEGDILRFNTSLVTVPVSVVNRSGSYVPNLRRQDFRLFEDGVEQKIAYFAAVDQPFTVILLIDTSGSTKFRLEDIHNSAINFVGKLKPEDSVMVMSFDDRINVLCNPTSDRSVIERAIRRATTGGGTRLYDAVDAVLMKELKTITGRKAVVLFTDGVDTTSRHSYESTLREAEESDAPIYTVDYDTSGNNPVFGQGLPFPRGRGGVIFGTPFPLPGGGGSPGANPGDYRRAIAYLHALSNTTGGRFYSADGLMGISQAFTWIAEDLGRQYSLGYYPKTAGESGQRRQIKVRVNEADLVVKARDSYIYTEKKPDPNQTNEKQPFISEN